ncbi:hypothetical protein HA150_07055 [Prochlorococcus marinus XMU1414]|uniref:Uncharacterized protein n=1 Tax=Prochlorococcus marinus XMU1424 TaxID=2774497 RepID=A0A9D9BVD4_PROMR|nr:hypothetical protein [Prochlorococcus marinus]MBO8228657.1 hypothetical protein [Prochlorococcus marinus XMU1414]MBW3046136.1 hypothetical protein [Prochlorococcus marinus str. MU1414]MCR8531572.1 hypothetical protein [Prochlorococcus marinus XMU1420]MCR8535301.1 hypothetical protein [Prochlorococcus marinus XMU1424]
MKIAFLFSGQLREVEVDLFRKSLLNLTKDLDYTIFAYTWKEMGKSLNHNNNIPEINIVENIEEKIKFLFRDFNLLDFDYESFSDFKKKLKGEHREIFNSKNYDFGTVNSLPQIYTLNKSFELLEKSKLKFDLVFRCRFDSIFIHPIKLFPLKKIISSRKIFNLNFGRAYYPNRIYDIFFGGSRESMNFIATIWDDIPFLVKNNFDNGLDKRDCCRILYLAASINNIKIKSFPSRICDVYRNNELIYSKYLISSHLVKLRLNKKNILYLAFILKWFWKRNLSNIKIILYLIKALIFIPLVYLKRLKYLKIS